MIQIIALIVLLQASGEQPPENVPNYDDWMGAPAFDWVEKGNQFGGWDLEDV